MATDDDDLASFYATFNKSVSASGATSIPPSTTSQALTRSTDDDGNDTANSPVKLRSMYVSSMDDKDYTEAQNNNNNYKSNGRYSGQYAERALPIAEDDDDIKEEEEKEEDLYESEPEPVTLPESTHSLFFTMPFCSLPVGYAVSIVVISFICLWMALVNNLQANSSPGNPLGIPANVSRAVRIAQYMSILIALLMEEEIPTGLHLLRTIPEPSFNNKFPDRSYRKFVAAAILRIVLGYIFLINVFVILAQATGVLDIFYDVLALQFISELDDIGFSLAKMNVLGKKLQRACTAKLYQTEFEKNRFKRNRKSSLFLKSVYFLNLAAFIGGMVFVSTRQNSGYFQCSEITADFGDGIWEDPIIVLQDGTVLTGFTLIFSYFNGVYVQDGTHQGRPVYKERRKFDSNPFDDTSPVPIIPAEIKYSQESGGWVFTHPLIRKSLDEDASEAWLLRSPETEEYDLLNVQGEWNIWLGRIDTTKVSISCNACNDDVDCNLNGKCQEDGTCKCKSGATSYLGTHCEIQLKESCGTIKSEGMNVTYSIQKYSKTGSGEPDTLFQEYNRPVYTHIENFPNATEDELYWLVYTGRRWFGLVINLKLLNATEEDLVRGTENFHAFWSNAYAETTFYVSDPTTGDGPVGVDFYEIGERGDQFGPFGALYPLQKDGQVGRGIFRCTGPPTLKNGTSFT